jgi:hypothetical protein
MDGLLSKASKKQDNKMPERGQHNPIDGNFLFLRPFHGDYGPKVPVTPEYIVLQRVLQKWECMSILTRIIMHLISNDWLIKAT